MRQQIGNAEDRISFVLADAEIHDRKILPDHDTVHGQRDRTPLVLPDPAVIVGLEICQFLLLVKRIRLQIEAGAVDVGAVDSDAFPDVPASEDRRQDRLSAVDLIDLVPCAVGLAAVEAFIARLDQGSLCVIHALPLRLADREEVLVALCEFLRLFDLFRRFLCDVRVRPGELLLQLLSGRHFLFCHTSVLSVDFSLKRKKNRQLFTDGFS